jgi:dTDP-4-dehydrorhamnose 3,5-epimerase
LTIEPLAIPEVKLVTPARFGDARGHFSETYNAQRFEDAGLPDLFVQDNQSLSGPAGTLRGLHYQTPPYAQAKLVRVLRGRILDVAVDIRAGSPSYGRHVRAELSAESGTQIYVPAGFLHGFVTLEPDTEVFYKVTAFYSRECDRGIAWDDPDLGIDWGVDPASVLLSDKDRAQPAFRSLETPFSYGGEGAGPGRGGRE